MVAGRRARPAAAAALAALLASAGASGCFRCSPAVEPSPEDDVATCTNGADDDEDGAADCADADCVDACLGSCTPAACAAGAGRCIGGTGLIEECVGGALWCRRGTCPEGRACDGISCTGGTCIEGDVVCDGNGLVNRCLAGAWLDPQPCADPAMVCDPTLGDACRAVTCAPGARWCASPAEVAACSDLGVDLGVVQTCAPGESCAGGACTSPCDVPGACEYFAVGVDDAPANAIGEAFLVSVSNPNQASVDAELQTREAGAAGGGAGGAWVPLEGRGLAIGTAVEIPLEERSAAGSGLFERLALRLVTTLPVSAHVLDDVDAASHAGAAYALWPTARLGTDHVVATWPHEVGPDGAAGGPADARPGGVAVVATADGTVVSVVASAAVAAGPGVPALGPGGAGMVVLDGGDVLQLESAGTGDDLTGTSIVASAPVLVVAFHVCADAPGSGAGAGCDKIADVVPPLDRWGFSHLVATMGTGEVIRVVAGPSAALVSFDDGGSGCAPGLPPLMLAPGAFADVALGVGLPPGREACGLVAESDAPVLLALLHGDAPALSFVRPDGRRTPALHFSNAPWSGFLDVTVRGAASYALAGATAGAAFYPVGVLGDVAHAAHSGGGLAVVTEVAGQALLAAHLVGRWEEPASGEIIAWSFDPGGPW